MITGFKPTPNPSPGGERFRTLLPPLPSWDGPGVGDCEGLDQ